MKKILLIIALIVGISTGANAQIKSSGFKLIGSAGFGASWLTIGASVKGEGSASQSGFGTINPQFELTAGANVTPNLFIGLGVGYDARCGVSNLGGTANEVKIPATLRFYVSPQNSKGFIIDLKGGYSRLCGDGGMNGGNLFVGPGYMFSRRCAISLGYEGSYFRYSKGGGTLTYSYNGLAARFSVEF